MIIIEHKPGEIVLSGHANYAEPGKDIVCAAVSVLVQNFITSVYRLTGCEMDIKEIAGQISNIKYGDIRNMTEVKAALLNSFLIGVEMIAQAYPENVKIK